MHKLSKFCAALAIAMPLSLGFAPAKAAIVVDPVAGGDFGFLWLDGLGPIDSILDIASWTSLGDSVWSITSPVAGVMGIFVRDDFIPGDAFGLVVDGVATAWDTAATNGSGYFEAAYMLDMAAGATYLVTLDVTTDCCGSGAAYASFIADDIAPVPLPATLPLMGAALAGVGALRLRRRNRA